jgi:hypothetical protein
MNIDRRQRLLAIGAIAIIGLFAGDLLVYKPLTRSWSRRSVQIAELKRSVDEGKRLLSREQSIRSRWESMRTNTLPRQVSVAEGNVIKSFDRWYQDSRISITSIRPTWKEAGEDYLTVECRVDAYGSLSTLARFLYDIEKDPLALKVDSIEINSRGEDGQQLALGLQVSGLLLGRPE